MKVSYNRALDYQYMMIDIEENEKEDYRLAMLINNRIPGFLPAYLQRMNGRSSISYEITSLEVLSAFLESRKISYEEMTFLLLQFCGAVQEAGRYLLNGEGILLDPEYIYISDNLEKVFFCYYPYQEVPVYQSVNVLCRFLIDHIHYDDRRSIELAYGLFQESLKENLTISSIVGCLKSRLPAKDRAVPREQVEQREIQKAMQESTQEDKTEKEEESRQMPEKNGLNLNALFMTGIIVCVLASILVCLVRKLLQREVIRQDLLVLAVVLFSVIIVCVGVVVYRMMKQQR